MLAAGMREQQGPLGISSFYVRVSICLAIVLLCNPFFSNQMVKSIRQWPVAGVHFGQ
jgi:hypothetical protein